MRTLLLLTLAAGLLAGWTSNARGEDQTAEKCKAKEPDPGKQPCDEKVKAACKLIHVLCTSTQPASRNSVVREQAANALRQMGADAVGPLGKAFADHKKDSEKDFPVRLAKILGDIGPEAVPAGPQLAAALDNDCPAPQEVREAAIVALGKIFKPPQRLRVILVAAEAAESALKDAVGLSTYAAAIVGSALVGDKGPVLGALIVLPAMSPSAMAKFAGENTGKRVLDAKFAAQAWSDSQSAGTQAKAEAQSLANLLEGLKTSAETARSKAHQLIETWTNAEDAANAAKHLTEAATTTEFEQARKEADDYKCLRSCAVDALSCALDDSCFIIKVLAAEALAQIFGKVE